MRTSHYKWILLPSQPLVQNYTPKGLGISYTESLLKTNDTCLDKNERDKFNDMLRLHTYARKKMFQT